jgi:hypothetical protein
LHSSFLTEVAKFNQLQTVVDECTRNLALDETRHNAHMIDLNYDELPLNADKYMFGFLYEDDRDRLKEIHEMRATSRETLEKFQRQLRKARKVQEAARPAYIKLCEDTSNAARLLGFQ